jgi:tRNA threonylcarbamoyladenosine biosynthesis protein TsaB
MLLLALDTSTRYASIALCSTEELYGEYTWYSRNNHSVELLEYAHRLLKDCQRTWQELDAVAVATGPGSFSGVRVALSMAKTLAFTWHKPLVGISSLDILAQQQLYWPGLLCAILEAGRGQLYAACYSGEALSDQVNEDAPVRLQRAGDYLCDTPAQLIPAVQAQVQFWQHARHETAPPPVLFCGEISAPSRQALATAFPAPHSIISSIGTVRRASSLALLALQRLHAHQFDDPLTLEPLYLRRPSITTSTRKQPLFGKSGLSPGLSTTEREEGALPH